MKTGSGSRNKRRGKPDGNWLALQAILCFLVISILGGCLNDAFGRGRAAWRPVPLQTVPQKAAPPATRQAPPCTGPFCPTCPSQGGGMPGGGIFGGGVIGGGGIFGGQPAQGGQVAPAMGSGVSPAANHHQAVVQITSPHGGGTGTLVWTEGGEGIVLTAAHVVDSQPVVNVAWPSGQQLAGRVIALDNRGQNYGPDLAVIHVQSLQGPQVVIPVAGDGQWPKQGDTIELVGYGGGNFRHWFATVTGYTETDGVRDNVTLVANTQTISGDSGGPMIYQGKLAGVLWGGPLLYPRGPMTATHGTCCVRIRGLLGRCFPRALGPEPTAPPATAPPATAPPAAVAPQAPPCQCDEAIAGLRKDVDDLRHQVGGIRDAVGRIEGDLVRVDDENEGQQAAISQLEQRPAGATIVHATEEDVAAAVESQLDDEDAPLRRKILDIAATQVALHVPGWGGKAIAYGLGAGTPAGLAIAGVGAAFLVLRWRRSRRSAAAPMVPNRSEQAGAGEAPTVPFDPPA